jgi:hypothetical protein
LRAALRGGHLGVWGDRGGGRASRLALRPRPCRSAGRCRPPAGKTLAPTLALAEFVPLLRRYRELDLDDTTADLLIGMSA